MSIDLDTLGLETADDIKKSQASDLEAMYRSSKEQPSDYAAASKIASDGGIPLDVVINRRDEAIRHAYMPDWNRVSEEAPMFSSYISSNPGAFAVLKNDAEKLAAVERSRNQKDTTLSASAKSFENLPVSMTRTFIGGVAFLDSVAHRLGRPDNVNATYVQNYKDESKRMLDMILAEPEGKFKQSMMNRWFPDGIPNANGEISRGMAADQIGLKLAQHDYDNTQDTQDYKSRQRVALDMIDYQSEKLNQNKVNVDAYTLPWLASSLIDMGAQVGSAAMAGLVAGPAGAALGFAAPVVGSSFADAKQAGMDDARAQENTAVKTAFEVIPEMFGLSEINKAIHATSPMFQRIMNASIANGGEEAVTTILNQVYDAARDGKKPDIPKSLAALDVPDNLKISVALLDQQLQDTIIGAAGGAGITASGAGAKAGYNAYVSRLESKRQEKKQAILTENKKLLDEVQHVEGMDATHFATNDVKDALHAIDGDNERTVFVDPSQLLNQEGLSRQQIETLIPSATSQLDQALSVGGLVSVPRNELIAHLAATKDLDNESIIRHFKEDPTSDSKFEIEQAGIDSQIKQADILIAKSADSEKLKTQRSEVYQQALQDLNESGMFTGGNDKRAAIWAAMATATAMRTGKTPMEMYKEAFGRVTDEAAIGEAFNQYAGQKAQGADLTALQRAKQAVNSGADAEQTRQETGWFRGPDNKWRFEIDDSQMVITGLSNKSKLSDVKRGSSAVWGLRNLIDHPVLFNAYPFLDEITVSVSKGYGDGGSYTPKYKQIQVGYSKDDGINKDTLLHEIQHAIQEHEGFAEGGTARDFMTPETNELMAKKTAASEKVAAINAKLKTATGEEYQQLLSERSSYVKDAQIDGIDIMESANDQYKRLAGEVEARDTGSRAYMSAEERKANKPYISQGIPDDQVIVRLGGNGVQRSEADKPKRFTARLVQALRGDSRFYQSAQDQTKTPAFKKWFGDSKVVDANGKPLVVYHGTNADFSVFQNQYAGKTWEMFSDSSEYSNRFAHSRGGVVMPVYLSFQNPLDLRSLPAIRGDVRSKLIELLDEVGVEWSNSDLPYERDLYQIINMAGHKSGFADNVKKAGFDSIIMPDNHDGDYLDDGGIIATTYIALDPAQIKSAIGNNGAFDPANPNILMQNKAAPRGTYDPSTRNINLTHNADLSTFLHESGHMFLDIMVDMSLTENASESLKKDMDVTMRWFGIEGDTPGMRLYNWSGMSINEKRQFHEKWAESFEQYLFEGKAPSMELAHVFSSFRQWLLHVYKSIAQFVSSHDGAKLNDEVRGVFDRMLATEEQIQEAEAARGMLPLFDKKPDNMTDAEWAVMQQAADDYARSAFDQMTARSLRDMKWLSNAKNKTLRKLQREADAQRREAHMEARQQILSQNIYRAWQFLKAPVEGAAAANEKAKASKEVDSSRDSLLTAIAKMGGLNMEQAVSQYGLDSKDFHHKGGMFGMPVLRKTGGMSPDAMGEALSQHGYLPLDEHGKWDILDLEDKLREEAAGRPHYSTNADYDVLLGDTQYAAAPDAESVDFVGGRLSRQAIREMYDDADLAEMQGAQVDTEGKLLQSAPTTKWKDMRDAILKKLRVDYKNPVTVEARNGDKIIVSYGGIKHALNNGVPSLHESALAMHIQEAIRAAEHEETAADKHGRDDPHSMTTYHVDVFFDGVPHKATIYVRNHTDGNRYYDHSAVEKEIPPGRHESASKPDSGIESPAHPSSGISISLSEVNQAVNEDGRTLEGMGVLSDEGLHPDTVADLFGLSSGDELVRKLLTMPDPVAEIERLTDEIMLQRHADLATPEARERAAEAAIHNEAHVKFLATELAALNRAIGKPRLVMAAAKEYVNNIVAGTKIKDLKPGQYVAAEAKAGKAAEKAFASGNRQDAALQKRNQVLHAMTVNAVESAREDVEKAKKFFNKIAMASNKKNVTRGRDPDVVNAINAIIAQYGFYTSKGNNALEYLKIVEQNDPEMFAHLEPAVMRAMTDGKSWRDMTHGEFMGFRESIDGLWYLAKRSREMEINGNRVSLEEAAGALHSRMVEIGIPDSMPGEKGALTSKELIQRKLQVAGSLLRRVEQWAEAKDGKFGGAFLRYIFQPVKIAADNYRHDKVKYRKAFSELLKSLPAMKRQAIEAPELGYTFGAGELKVGLAELLHAVLHTGNESNKRKLLLGRGWAREREDGSLDTGRWDSFMLRMVREGKLTKEHFSFAQGVWDLLEETKPLAQKAHREVFGHYFAEVTADQFGIQFPDGETVTYRGGYVPAQTDTRIVNDAAVRALADQENQNMSFAFPSTSKGFTKSRVEYNKPLLLDIRSLTQHMDKVLLFSHMESPVRDVAKLLKRTDVSEALYRIDPTAVDGMLQPWLARSARQAVETPILGDGQISKILSVVRSRAGMALMMGNISNIIQQVTGFSSALTKVKARHIRAGIAAYLSDPKGLTESVASASIFMRDRIENEVSELSEQMNEILIDPTLYQKGQAWTKKHAYFLQSALDNAMGPMIWTGAYNQSIEEGFSHDDAVQFANGVIRQTQGTTLPEDVSRIETGPAYGRAFTQFIGYFNMLANTNATELIKIQQETGLKNGRALGVVFFGILAPAWIAEAIALAFKGGPDDPDDDGYLDDWISQVIGMGLLKNLLAGVPFAGTFLNVAINNMNKNPSDDRASISPAIGMLESGAAAMSLPYHLAAGDNISAKKSVTDIASLVTVATGLPARPLARPLGYLAGMAQDKINPTGGADFVRGMATGAASPDSKAK